MLFARRLPLPSYAGRGKWEEEEEKEGGREGILETPFKPGEIPGTRSRGVWGAWGNQG